MRRALTEAGVRPDLLELEVTEGALITDLTAAAARLEQLHEIGITIALDDFGTGYSSLSYVRDLDVDVLKVDKSFVLGLGADPSAVAIVRTILTLADMLSLGVIIEGIEDPKQLAQLQELGGRFIQGYLFGRPMDLAEISDFIRKGVAMSADEASTKEELDPDALPEGAWLHRGPESELGVRPYWPI